MTRLPLTASLLLLCAGCAADGTRYPSLAPRAIEKQGFAEPEAPAPAPVATDPALDRQIADWTKRLDQVAAGARDAGNDAESKASAARGKPAGSDAWLDAQTALAGLDDWRAQTSAVATDIEEASIARAATLAAPYPALAALGERAEAEATRQAATIARLQAMLAPA